MTEIPVSIGDFSVLPVTIPPLPSYPHPATHHIYVRRNAPKIPTQNDPRSLFLTNVPVDSTELHLRGLFTALVGAGRFESATFDEERKPSHTEADLLPGQAARLAAHSKKRKREDDVVERAKEEAAAQLPSSWSRTLRRSGSSAVVLLADEKSAERALKAIAKANRTKRYPTWGEGVEGRVPPLGSRWLKAHARLTYPDKAVVEESVNTFFTMFNRKEQEAADLAKRLRNEPDEDGFVTVTRGGRAAPAGKREAEEARKKMLEKAAGMKEELSNFYRFQLREKKKAEQEELLKRFEDDKRKVSAMREKRAKFRPET